MIVVFILGPVFQKGLKGFVLEARTRAVLAICKVKYDHVDCHLTISYNVLKSTEVLLHFC